MRPLHQKQLFFFAHGRKVGVTPARPREGCQRGLVPRGRAGPLGTPVAPLPSPPLPTPLLPLWRAQNTSRN